MYMVNTLTGYKIVSKLDIAHDMVITEFGPQRVNSLHPCSCAVHRIQVGEFPIALPDFLLVKTLAGDIPVERLITGIKLICWGKEEQVQLNSIIHKKAKANKIGINGYFGVSGLEVKNK